jgi:aryl carrier-like protein
MMPAFASARRSAERVMLDCWREVLQRPTVGLDDNFFDLGGSSLQAIQLYEQLRTKLRAPVTLLAIFEHPTIATFLDALFPETGAASPVAAPPASPAIRVAGTAEAMTVAERVARQQQAFDGRAFLHRDRHS